MARPKRRGKIKVRQNVQLVHKNDKTRVERDSVGVYKKAPTKVPSNGAVFKVRLRKK